MTNALGSTHAPEFRYAPAEIDTLNAKIAVRTPDEKKIRPFVQ